MEYASAATAQGRRGRTHALQVTRPSPHRPRSRAGLPTPLHAAGESAVTTPEHGKPIVLVKMERWLVAFSGTFTGSAGGFDRSSLRHGQRDWQPKLPLA
jgi:hypothetical protein